MNSSALLLPGGLPLGLGCSRLGSVNGATNHEARALLRTALDEGIRVFDTANIYGQGASERLISEVVTSQSDCVVISKAGKYVSPKRRALVPLKGAIRTLTRRSADARTRVSAVRSKPMPTRWDAAHITRSLDGSLRRLRREWIDVFLLHSPSAEIVSHGEALNALSVARAAGKINYLGVSVDDPATALVSLADPRVELIQIPLRPGSTEYDGVIAQANAQGVQVIAREILGGVNGIAAHPDPGLFASERIASVAKDDRIALSLVGTTNRSNLRAAASAARNAGTGGART